MNQIRAGTVLFSYYQAIQQSRYYKMHHSWHFTLTTISSDKISLAMLLSDNVISLISFSYCRPNIVRPIVLQASVIWYFNIVWSYFSFICVWCFIWIYEHFIGVLSILIIIFAKILSRLKSIWNIEVYFIILHQI